MEAADARQAGKFRAALAQIAPVLGDRERNLEMHLAQIEEARRQDADLIVFPELSLTGYFLRDMVPDVAIAADVKDAHSADKHEFIAPFRQSSISRGYR